MWVLPSIPSLRLCFRVASMCHDSGWGQHWRNAHTMPLSTAPCPPHPPQPHLRIRAAGLGGQRVGQQRHDDAGQPLVATCQRNHAPQCGHRLLEQGAERGRAGRQLGQQGGGWPEQGCQAEQVSLQNRSSGLHSGLPSPAHPLTGRSSAELARGTKMVRTAAGSRCQAAASRVAAPSARVRVSRHARLC